MFSDIAIQLTEFRHLLSLAV